jgi:hypothetical protein
MEYPHAAATSSTLPAAAAIHLLREFFMPASFRTPGAGATRHVTTGNSRKFADAYVDAENAR